MINECSQVRGQSVLFLFSRHLIDLYHGWIQPTTV